MIARRLSAMGIAVVFVGAVRAMDAAGIGDAVADCLMAAVAATFVTWAIAP